LKIPTGREQHWTRVQVWLFVAKTQVDTGRLFQQVGERDPAGDSWFISEADHASCRTRVTLFTYEPDAGASPDTGASPSWIFRIDTSRIVGPPPSRFEQLTHEAFFSALRQSMPGDVDLFLVADVDLEFPSPPAEWRLPILANPPKLSGVEGELGAITLSGITMDFTGSTLGLSRAKLVRSFETPKLDVSLTYPIRLSSSVLTELYEQVLEKAERFSALFVNAQPEAAVVTA
jgi:hypothetical protein